VDVVPKRDPGKTGNFEVVLAGANEELIHSKKTKGQGKCETEEELDAVLEKIEAHLASK